MKLANYRNISVAVGVLTLAILIGPGVSRAAFHPHAEPRLSPEGAFEAQRFLFLPLSSNHFCPNFTAPAVVIRSVHFPPSWIAGQFSYPEDCRTGLLAGSPIPVSGVVANVPEGAYLWVFVYAGNDRYYPQCNHALGGDCGVITQNGQWSVTVYLGRKGVKEHFHLALVELDQAANDEITQRMKEWARSGFFPGMAISELDPYPIRELDAIQVETAGQ